MMERRHESRTHADLSVRVWGVDTQGGRFLEEARAQNISRNGALLTDFHAEVRCGDLVIVRYAGKKARYRVVWICHSDQGLRSEAAVQRLEEDECPWEELLARPRADGAGAG